MVHSSSIILAQAHIDTDAVVGPYCVLGVPSSFASPSVVDGHKDSIPIPLRIGTRSELCSHVVVGEGTQIGSGVWCDHHTYVGSHTRIGDSAQIMYGARVYDRVVIRERAWIAGFVCNNAVVEEGAICLGQLVHRFVNAIESTPEAAPVIRRDAFVGMGAIIVGGIEVGSGAYVGAGAVLVGSARAGRLYLGIPAVDSGPAPNPFRRFRDGGNPMPTIKI